MTASGRVTIGLGWLLIIISLLVTGCGSSESGHLEVRVGDHREAIDDFSELRLTFSAIGLHPAGEPRSEGWVELEPRVKQLDLTQYVHGQQAVITQAAVATGPYNAIRLTVDRAEGTLKDGQSADVKVRFETAALDFQISSGETTILELDLVVLDLSDHPGQGYELHLRKAIVNSVFSPDFRDSDFFSALLSLPEISKP